MRKLACPLLLTGLFILLIALSLPSGCVYGSNTDWLSQHAALAETIRNACLEQDTLLPDFLALGGGSNGFQFSYYGYLRPDILIGCLLPSVPMYQILIFYSLAGYLASVLLFYLLLICLHSFYYAPACFLATGWYWLKKSGKAFFRPWLVSSALAACMSAALLLPTGLAILEHRRASAAADSGLFTFFGTLRALRSRPYGPHHAGPLPSSSRT